MFKREGERGEGERERENGIFYKQNMKNKMRVSANLPTRRTPKPKTLIQKP
jgi:hypothetical protein